MDAGMIAGMGFGMVVAVIRAEGQRQIRGELFLRVHAQADAVVAALVRFIRHMGISLRPFGFSSVTQADLRFAPRRDAPTAAQSLLVFNLRLQIQIVSITVSL